MKYFKDCKTLEDLKKEYKRLAMKFHPDINKDPQALEIMKTINNEYDQLFIKLKDIHNKEEKNHNRQNTETPEVFRNIINIIITMENIQIELIGSWLWISGSTYQYKDTLKELGFQWSKSKKAWYLSDNLNKFDYKKKTGLTMDKIKAIHGSQTIQTEKAVYIG